MYVINNSVNVEEMTVNKDTVIDTIFVAEYDVSSKIGD